VTLVTGRPEARNPVLAVCGGGNAGHLLAVITSQTFPGDIVWLTSSNDSAERLREGVFSPDGLRSTGAFSGRADKVRLISSDPAEVIPHAGTVLIAVPSFGHGRILDRISPFLNESALVGVLPSRSGFEFPATHTISGIRPRGDRRVFGLQTLPWSARIQQRGKIVHVLGIKKRVLMATLPHREAEGLVPWLSHLLGIEIVPTSNFLNLTLGNPGQVIHPGLMYGLFAEWNGAPYREDNIPRFYADATDKTGMFVEGLSREITAVARRIQESSAGKLELTGVLSIHDWLRLSYPTQIGDASTVATSFRTLAPLQARKPPMREAAPGEYVPDFNYRYISEDVPFGLVVVKAIATLSDVDTPSIDAVIAWAQEKLGKHYLVNGTVSGSDAHELRIPQNYGIGTMTNLIEWYLGWS